MVHCEFEVRKQDQQTMFDFKFGASGKNKNEDKKRRIRSMIKLKEKEEGMGISRTVGKKNFCGWSRWGMTNVLFVSPKVPIVHKQIGCTVQRPYDASEVN